MSAPLVDVTSSKGTHRETTMRAIRLHSFGPAENLVYEEVPDRIPAEDQVRIAVEACGVHLIDTTIRRGISGGPFPLPDLPMVPGREVAGTVDATGPGVDERWVGRRVVAHLGQASGGYAELAVASVGALHVIPDHVAADATVAMIGTGRTTMGILGGRGASNHERRRKPTRSRLRFAVPIRGSRGTAHGGKPRTGSHREAVPRPLSAGHDVDRDDGLSDEHGNRTHREHEGCEQRAVNPHRASVVVDIMTA